MKRIKATAASRKCEACGKTIVSTSFIDNDGRLYCSFEHLVEFGELDDVTGRSAPERRHDTPTK